jgi:NAD(P)-dependent dehydrogenase (short-subunit alcohol dehydrogenase family)
MKGLAGKVCIIAGGATGIGQATAVRLAEEGAKVVVGDVNLAAAEETVARARAAGKASGGTAIACAFDMTDEPSIAALIQLAVDEFGGLDAIHINANDMRVIMRDGDALEVSLADFDRTHAVGLRGHLVCTRYALPHLLERGGGAIVYTTSVAAYIGETTRVSYGMAKAGILALMRHVARRWGGEGIRANAIAPGLVITEQLRDHYPDEIRQKGLATVASLRLGESADIAAMVAMLFSDDGAWINAQCLTVDGGATMR